MEKFLLHIKIHTLFLSPKKERCSLSFISLSYNHRGVLVQKLNIEVIFCSTLPKFLPDGPSSHGDWCWVTFPSGNYRLQLNQTGKYVGKLLQHLYFKQYTKF